jgi:hypothetical protein
VSKGLGILQRRVLDFLATAGEPQTGVAIAVALHAAPLPVPYTLYSSVRRAAAGLARRGDVLVGAPQFGPRGQEHARAIYWLPSHKAPELKRLFPAEIVERAVLESIKVGPSYYSSVVGRVAKMLARDNREWERLRMPILRAVRRLFAGGKIKVEATTDDFGRPQKLITVVM